MLVTRPQVALTTVLFLPALCLRLCLCLCLCLCLALPAVSNSKPLKPNPYPNPNPKRIMCLSCCGCGGGCYGGGGCCCCCFVHVRQKGFYPPMQILFALKEKNGGKLDSHLWFFHAFAEHLQPKYTVLVDVGTMPRPKAILRSTRTAFHLFCLVEPPHPTNPPHPTSPPPHLTLSSSSALGVGRFYVCCNFRLYLNMESDPNSTCLIFLSTLHFVTMFFFFFVEHVDLTPLFFVCFVLFCVEWECLF